MAIGRAPKSNAAPTGPQPASDPGARQGPRSSRPKVGLMIKRSAYRIYLEERPDPNLRRLVAERDEAVRPLRASHEQHESTVTEVTEALAAVDAEVVFVHRTGEPFD